MTIEILMPALSPTMEVGNVNEWYVKDGDKVSAGDIIAEIETDKAAMELEANDDGIFGRALMDAGTEDIPVNTVIALLLEDGEDPSVLDAAEEVARAKVPAPVDESQFDTPADMPEPIPALDPTPAPAPIPAPATSEGGTAGSPINLTGRAQSIAASTGVAPTIAPAENEIPEGTAMGSMSVREALRDAMAEEMRLDGDVFLMGEEVAEYHGAYKVSQGLLEEFGSERVIDTPITEHGFAGLGVGAAFGGLRPIVEFMTFNFAMQAIDQIVNSASKTLYMSGGQVSCPIVFRGPNGAAARVAAQHSQCYASWYAHCPGMKVVAPYSAADAKGLLKSAIRDPNPVVFLEHELLYGRSFDVPVLDDHMVPLGKAKVVRTGADVTLVTFSFMVEKALQAADTLAGEGIDAEVIDLRTLRPLDMATLITSVEKTNRAVTIEEGWPVAGMGSELSARLMEEAFDYLDAPVMRIASKDVPLPYANNLEALVLPQADDIVAAAKAVCYRT